MITAPRIIAGFISALLGFTAFTEAPRTVSEAPTTTISAEPYLILPATTTSSTIYIDPYSSACEQFSALAVNLGWDPDQRTVLESVLHRESRCIPNQVNSNDPNGGSRGLLQINGFWTPWLIERGIITQTSDLLHAETNLLAGLAIYNYGVERYGFGWGPWSVK